MSQHHYDPRQHGHQYSYTPAPQPPKRRRKWPWVVLGIVGLLVVIGIANGGGQDTISSASAPSQDPAAEVREAIEQAAEPSGKVTLRVEGKGKAMVTWMHEGGQSQKTVDLPWETTIEDTFIASVTAQRQSGGDGEITCQIIGSDGSVRAESSSAGAYAVTTCSG